MKVIGYGEDALCAWALRYRLAAILRALGDPTDPQDAVVFLRPSFGRLGGGSMFPGPVADSAQFGEFDGLVGSRQGVYLVESKWSRSSGLEGGKAVLRPEQVFRHKVFRSYLRAWRAQQHQVSWTAFLGALGGLLEVDYISIPIAPLNSQLARSLERILMELAPCGPEITDVLLYLRIQQGHAIAGVEPSHFRLVTLDCPSTNGFIDMEAA